MGDADGRRHGLAQSTILRIATRRHAQKQAEGWDRRSDDVAAGCRRGV